MKKVWIKGGRPAKTPTAEEILQSLAPHPKLLHEVVGLIMDGYAGTCLGPWEIGCYDGAEESGGWDRRTPGAEGAVIARIFRGDMMTDQDAAHNEWHWHVYTHPDPEDELLGDNPPDDELLGEPYNPPDDEMAGEGHNYPSPRAAQVACDEWLLSQGYYLVEPLCEIADHITTYGSTR